MFLGFVGSFKGVSRKMEGCSYLSSKGVSMEVQGRFKDVLRTFQGCLKKVSRAF